MPQVLAVPRQGSFHAVSAVWRLRLGITISALSLFVTSLSFSMSTHLIDKSNAESIGTIPRPMGQGGVLTAP